MFSCAYKKGIGAQAEHQDEEEHHIRSRSCYAIKATGLHIPAQMAHTPVPLSQHWQHGRW
jgi:hypothetical protein